MRRTEVSSVAKSIVHFNSRERSELTPAFTPTFTSETWFNVILSSAKITTFPVTSKYKWEKKLSRSQKKRRPYWNSAF